MKDLIIIKIKTEVNEKTFEVEICDEMKETQYAFCCHVQTISKDKVIDHEYIESWHP